MIAALAAAALLQVAPADDADALINQAVDRLMEADQALAFTQGRCSSIYPEGLTDPYAAAAQLAVLDLGIEQLTLSVTRLRQMHFAEGADAAGSSQATIRGCVAEIDDHAADLQQNVDGLVGLVTSLSQGSSPSTGTDG